MNAVLTALLIPFLGTALGSAFVFFIDVYLCSNTPSTIIIISWRSFLGIIFLTMM